MTKEMQILSEEMEKLSALIVDELTSTLVNLSGSLEGISPGTHIKIPQDAGYVSYYRSPDNTEISCWMKLKMTEQEAEYNQYLESETQDTNSTKSD